MCLQSTTQQERDNNGPATMLTFEVISSKQLRQMCSCLLVTVAKMYDNYMCDGQNFEICYYIASYLVTFASEL